MTFNCYKCNFEEVVEEFTRCASCEKDHKALARELDSRPRTVEKKVREKLYPIKEMKGGIQITTWISREDAHNMGIKVE